MVRDRPAERRDDHRQRRDLELARGPPPARWQSTVRNVVTCGIAAACSSPPRDRSPDRRRRGPSVGAGHGRPSVTARASDVLGGDPAVGSGPGHASSRSTPRSFADACGRARTGRRGARSPAPPTPRPGRPPSPRIATAEDLERHQRCAHGDGVAGAARGASTITPGERRRDLDGRLRGLDLDDRLVQRDVVALRDEPRRRSRPPRGPRRGPASRRPARPSVRGHPPDRASAIRSTLGRYRCSSAAGG